MPCDRSGVWARLRVPLYGGSILSLALVTGIGVAAAQSRDVSFGAQRAPVTSRSTLASPNGSILHDWRSIWMTPALGAVGVMVVFLIFFRDPATSSRRA